MAIEADLTAAAAAVDVARGVVEKGFATLAANGDVDSDQVVAYDLAHAAAAVEIASGLMDYAAKGDVEARITCAFTADAIHTVATGLLGREAAWGAEPGALDDASEFMSTYRSPAFLSELAGEQGPRHLDEELGMVADTFRRFAEDKIVPVAEEIHRKNEDIPEDVISGLAELGAFGLSVPEEYGGFATGGEGEYLAMVAATEELSRGSLGVGGSLITRPEILTRALVKGGTEEQKKEWLPQVASGEVMCAVAATEPDYGSDVAGFKVTATVDGDGYRINGVKTWCTFAGRADLLMLLARTDPDKSKAHKGLSLFIVPKERGEGHGFELTQ
ncbi:MAG TPA: acyl-CoA dehydrogenase family protein, partial [Actinomycetota bacterium]|nr:acyl-CoA dehydrogenase family protein [Actinomycetota bacterium]